MLVIHIFLILHSTAQSSNTAVQYKILNFQDVTWAVLSLGNITYSSALHEQIDFSIHMFHYQLSTAAVLTAKNT